MQIQLANGKWITLNSQQDEALAKIKSWLTEGVIPKLEYPEAEPLIFRLTGFAGTGKSTCIKEAINHYLTVKRWGKPVAVTAPTHKAKKVIADATGLDAKTIQGLIGLAPNTDVLDFDINNPEFALLNKPGIGDFSVIVVDEASMLNTDLFELLVRQATQYNVKLLFMCDSAQLPPVGEEISPVITSPKIAYFYQLTKVERQAGDNPLMLVYDKIRENIDSLKDSFPHTTNLIEVPKLEIEPFDPEMESEDEFNLRLDAYNDLKPVWMGIEFLNDLNTFGGRVVSAFASKKFAANPNHCKMLCWTNARVGYWNEAIRKTLIMKAREGITDPVELAERIHDNVLLPNELLMGNVTYKDGITNSGEYRVKHLEYDEVIMEYGKELAAEEIDFDDPEHKTREHQIKLAVYHVTLQDIDVAARQIKCSIVEPTSVNYKQYVHAFNWYLSNAKFNRRWPMYFQWKSEYMLITDIKNVDGKILVKKDVDYGYALSVHRSQGSTFDQVFIDEADIDKLEGRPFCEFLMKSDKEKAKKIQKDWRNSLEKLRLSPDPVDRKRYAESKDLPDALQEFEAKYPNFDAYYKQKQTEKNKLKYVALSRPKQKATVLTNKSVQI